MGVSSDKAELAIELVHDEVEEKSGSNAQRVAVS